MRHPGRSRGAARASVRAERSAPAAPKRDRRPLARRWRSRRSALPDLPRRVAPGVHVVQALLVLERVHRRPEPIVAVGQQLVLGEEPLERVRHEVFAVPQVVEDLALENVIPTVDAQTGLRGLPNARDLAAGSRYHEVIAQMRLHAEKARDPAVSSEMLEFRRQRQVGQAVGVVREELTFAGEVRLDGAEALPDARVDPRIDERDTPIADVALQELEPPTALAQYEVVRNALVVIAEVGLDGVGAVAEAEDEVLVPKVSVVLHHVPEDRAIADRHHRLRNVLVVCPQPHPQTTAEQNDLHWRLSLLRDPAQSQRTSASRVRTAPFWQL